MSKRKGRPRKTAEQKLKDALSRQAPADHILERRKLFSFVQAPKGGEIDSEVCDAIGQMCALGLLDGHGHDPIELRDKGRFWGGHYAKLMRGSAVKIGQLERQDRSSNHTGALTGADLLFDRMDINLPHYERSVLLSLLVDPLIGSDPFGREMCFWARALIDEALLKRGRLRPLMRFPDVFDRARLDAAVRGLTILVAGALTERRAA